MNAKQLGIIAIVLIAVSGLAIYFLMFNPQLSGTSIEMSVDKSKIKAGDYILATLKITNHDTDTKTYDVSPSAFDMLVYHENGTLWARYTEGQAFPEIYIRKNLTSGESYQEELYWNLYSYDPTTYKFIRPQPGIYQLEGILRSQPELKTEKISIEIEPRT